MLFVENIAHLPFILVAIVFLNRYIAGAILYLGFTSKRTLAESFEPTVTVIVPCFNEGRSVYETLRSISQLDYPASNLRIIVVDDASGTETITWLNKAEREISGVRVIYQKTNRGKRLNIAHAVRDSESEVVLSVDSDCILEPSALRHLLRHFSRPDVAAVGGVVRVLNADINWLTRMQSVKYWIGYEYLKNLEDAFDQIMCLSGCITAYRRSVLIELEPVLLGRHFLRMPVKYGEDRFLTRKIVERGYRTRMARDAICYTKVPDTLLDWAGQQLRWRRSNLVDFLGGIGRLHRLKPPVMVHYSALGMLLFVYPFAIWHGIIAGTVIQPLLFQMALVSIFAMLYEFAKLTDPSVPRVSSIWFLLASIMFTVSYLCLSPLALLTLATAGWETRNSKKAAYSLASTTGIGKC